MERCIVLVAAWSNTPFYFKRNNDVTNHSRSPFITFIFKVPVLFMYICRSSLFYSLSIPVEGSQIY